MGTYARLRGRHSAEDALCLCNKALPWSMPVYPISREEMEFVKDTLGSIGGHILIDVRRCLYNIYKWCRRSHGGVFETPYDTRLINWNSREPNNLGGRESCVLIRGAAGNFNDMDCHYGNLIIIC